MCYRCLIIRLTLGAAMAWLFAVPLGAVPGAEFTVQLKVHGRTIEGRPLQFSDASVQLLGRDGTLWEFDPNDATDFRQTSPGFRGYSAGELRGLLLREFGQGFEVSGTGHYLVVHPEGQPDPWGARLDELYRGFQHYFTARGFQPQAPQFPLVAVVCPTQADFFRQALRDGVQVSAGLTGCYSAQTNRVLLYDLSARQPAADWTVNAETIIHEATHQTAFNTGIHNRYALPPRWVAEGLGTMFEARGVWQSRANLKPADRRNGPQWKAFRKYAAGRRQRGALAEFIATDRLFQSDLEAAYAESWALSYFLAETEPRKYVAYLRRTVARPNFTAYLATERTRDFTAEFGDNLLMLEARLLRFIAELQ